MVLCCITESSKKLLQGYIPYYVTEPIPIQTTITFLIKSRIYQLQIFVAIRLLMLHPYTTQSEVLSRREEP